MRSDVSIVPGDPEGIRSAAGVLRDTAEDAGAVIDRLSCLHESSGESIWQGPASVAFREKLDELPGKLVKLRDSYTIASGALYTFAHEVDDLQEDAVDAERLQRDAACEVESREDERSAAERDYPCSDLSAYDDAVARARAKVGQAKQEVTEVANAYRCAEDRCIASLGDASDAGIENTFFGTVKEALAAIEKWADVFVKVLLIVALVVAVVALLFFTGGTAAFLLGVAASILKVAVVAGMIGGGATIGRWLLGDDVSAAELAFAALAFAPLLGTAGKAGKVGAFLRKAGSPTRVMLAAGKQLGRFPGALGAGSRLLSKLPPGWVAKGTILVKNKEFREAAIKTIDKFLGKPIATKVINGIPGVLGRIFGGPADVPGGASSGCEVPGTPSDPTRPPPTDVGPAPQPEPREQLPPRPSEPEPRPSGSDAPRPSESGGRAPGPSGGGSEPAAPGPSGGGSEPAPPGPQESAPPPATGGGAPEPTPSVPEPIGADPGAGEVCEPAVGGDPTAPGPSEGGGPGQPGPVQGGDDCPVGPGDGPPVGVDQGGNPEVTITLEDGTVITVDTPDRAGAAGGSGSGMDSGTAPDFGAGPQPDGPAEPVSPAQRVESAELIGASGPNGPGQAMPSTSPIDAGASLAGQAGGDGQSSGPVGEPGGPAESFAEAGSAGRGGGGPAGPGSEASFASPPAAGGAPPGAPGSPAGAEDTATVKLASAKPKIPLGSPLLIGGLAAGGLVGAGAAYVITDAKHKFRKEEEEDQPLPQPAGLRF